MKYRSKVSRQDIDKSNYIDIVLFYLMFLLYFLVIFIGTGLITIGVLIAQHKLWKNIKNDNYGLLIGMGVVLYVITIIMTAVFIKIFRSLENEEVVFYCKIEHADRGEFLFNKVAQAAPAQGSDNNTENDKLPTQQTDERSEQPIAEVAHSNQTTGKSNATNSNHPTSEQPNSDMNATANHQATDSISCCML